MRALPLDLFNREGSGLMSEWAKARLNGWSWPVGGISDGTWAYCSGVWHSSGAGAESVMEAGLLTNE